MKVTFFDRPSTDPRARGRLWARVLNQNEYEEKCSLPITVLPKLWDTKKQTVNMKVVCDEDERRDLLETTGRLRKFITEAFDSEIDRKIIAKGWLKKTIAAFFDTRHIKKSTPAADDTEDYLLPVFEQYFKDRRLSDVRKRQYMVLYRKLRRFEYYEKTVIGLESFVLKPLAITPQVLKSFEDYCYNEHELVKDHPEILEAAPEIYSTRRPTIKPRGTNSMATTHNQLRSLLNYCRDELELIRENPYRKFHFTAEAYGTPTYLTKEELDRIYAHDFSGKPEYERVRDIFIFHSQVACRIGDLMKLTPDNISDDCLNYIPHKTIDKRPQTITVPLSQKAIEILDKYRNRNQNGESPLSKGKILPFCSDVEYNRTIKKVVEQCGITRTVSVRDPLTGEEVQKRICDVVTTHMARRNFIANLYNKTQDPNLIGSMTGHTEGSKAFNRYNKKEIETKKRLVEALD